MKPIGYQVPGYGYFWAGNGVFVEAKNHHLAARIPVAEFKTRGLEDMAPEVTLVHGLIPQSYIDFVIADMMAKPETERYYAITWEDGKYWVRQPRQTATAGSVKYEIPDNTVVELHSHPPNSLGFSGKDNTDELGFKIYGVVSPLISGVRGQPAKAEVGAMLRVGVYGYFYELDWSQVFTGESSYALKEEIEEEIEESDHAIAENLRDYWKHLNSGAEK